MRKTWLQMLAFVCLLAAVVVALSVLVGAWGFTGAWICLGLLALGAFLADGGTPWGLIDTSLLVLCGPISLFVVVDSIYWTDKRSKNHSGIRQQS